jgi:hypothetical protein
MQIPCRIASTLVLVGGLAACDAAPAVGPVADNANANVQHAAGARPAGAGSAAAHNQVLAVVRQATARYHRLDVAEADGYVQASPCVESPLGGMGYHYMKESLLDGTVDPRHPELLVYAPMKNGRRQLVAVEFMVPAAAWDPFNDSPPMLGAQVFDDHRPPGSGGPPFPHYQLHAWVWAHNPAGIHAPYNPTVNCDYAD